MRVRLKDIAADLGISPMAVSKALRNHTDISEETRKRVLRRAEELNYRVDPVARSLVTGKSFLVGLVVPDLMQSFFAEIATAVAGTLAPAGYHVVISHTMEDANEEIANLQLLSARKVDGFIIVGVPYSCQGLTVMDEVSGGSPYGASTLAGGDGKRQPSENELAIARFQGRHVAEITRKLAG